ncbi:NUDIX hydrolase [Stenotrophomonas sp. NPDC101269]|uniref:NUDIX hydrolase n=1 Tax=Stenotrophomonas TaxID=40323 RepID=UPI00129205B5|nr:NUDIX hydrolase [Stenotrophomonas nematodicola]
MSRGARHTISVIIGALAFYLAYSYWDGYAWFRSLVGSVLLSLLTEILFKLIFKSESFGNPLKPGALLARVAVLSYFRHQTPTVYSRFSWVIRTIYFRSNVFTKAVVERASPAASAALLLALQRKGGLQSEAGLNFAHLKELARRATSWKDYRLYLLGRASSDFPSVRRRVEECANVDGYVIGDDLRTVSDVDLIGKIGQSNSERVHLFTTTSQLSKDFLDQLRGVMGSVESISFYICSPLMLSHRALQSLDVEYENPNFCTNFSQVVTSDDGVVHRAADHVRRVISVLSALNSLIKLGGPDKVRIKLFTQRYPGIKVRLLEVNQYVQLQPGSLSFQNNLYRFGLDSDRGEFVREVARDLQSLEANKLVLSVATSRADFECLKNRVLSELAVHLVSIGLSANDLCQFGPRIEAKAKSSLSAEILRDVISRLRKLEHLIASDQHLAQLQTAKGTAHISVGMICIDAGAILLIKKADAFYYGKYSIMAGHVEHGEGPSEAIARESLEELGVSPQAATLACAPFELADSCRHGAAAHIWFVFRCEVDVSRIRTDASEVDHHEWVPLVELQDWEERLTDGAVGVLRKLEMIR